MADLGLDFVAGATLARREKFGDWYRDPWGWPEFDWVAENATDLRIDDLVLKTSEGFTLRTQAEFHLIEVPKNRLSARPAVVQDAPSRLVYLSAVAVRSDTLHINLPHWVYGWRFREGGHLGDNRNEWPDYLDSLQNVDELDWGLQADISSFFASIDLDRMSTLVLDKYKKTAAAQLIIDIARSHDKLSTRSGLPQRSFASAALAHLYLAPLDDVFTDALQSDRIRVAARWMDDLNAIGPENELYKLHIRLQERARQLGLELNPSKSVLAPAANLKMSLNLENLREIDLPMRLNIGYDEPPFEPDPEQLLKLGAGVIDGSINHPTVARAVLRSLRQHGFFHRRADWMHTAHRIPHLAEPLALALHEPAGVSVPG